MKTAIRGAVESGMPVYAECGGLIYLTQGMEGFASDFVGIFPLRHACCPNARHWATGRLIF